MWAKNWELREYIKDFRLDLSDNPKANKGAEARYVILDYLLLRANPRLRTWVGVEKIMEDTGYTSKTSVAGALRWLFDRGAIYDVPVDKRVGKEAELSGQKYVFQLTGVIKLGGNWVRYLWFSHDDAEAMQQEWESVGLQMPVDFDFLVAEPKKANSPLSVPLPPTNSPLSVPDNSPLSVRTLSVPEALKGTSSLSSTSSEEDVLAGAGATSQNEPEKEVNPYEQAKVDEIPAVKDGHDKGNNDAPASDVDRAKLQDHPLVQLFCEKTKMTILSQGMVTALTKNISVLLEDGSRFTHPGGLIRQWDALPGFESFAVARLTAYQMTHMSPIQLLNHLRNFNKTNGKMPGFYAWRDKHPQAGMTVVQAPTKVAIGPVEPKQDELVF